MAVEDAAALAECLSHITGDSATPSLRTALTVFEKTRQPRTKAIQEASLQAGNILHLPDGPEQEARDAAMISDAETEVINERAFGLAHMQARDQWYGYDVLQAVREEWARTVGLQGSYQ
jgi:salicylate hydroxylase